MVNGVEPVVLLEWGLRKARELPLEVEVEVGDVVGGDRTAWSWVRREAFLAC